MIRLLKFMVRLFGACCMATLLAQALLVGWLWQQGRLTGDKLTRALEIYHDVDLDALEAKLQADAGGKNTTGAEYRDVLEARARKQILLTMRESAIDKAIDDLRLMQADLTTKRERYEEMKGRFEAEVQRLEQQAKAQGLVELQRTLEAIEPRQAKDQVLRFLEESQGEEFEKRLDDMVAIVKSMSLDKRRKIFDEFKTDSERQWLHTMLDRLRTGEPEVTLFKETRDQLAGTGG